MEESKMDEVWKQVKGYEGLYEVSNMGRIKSLPKTLKGREGSVRISKETILKQANHPSGYLSVVLCKNEVHKTTLVHRIVAETFIENPKAYPQVNHKNENKKDNRADNLEWCSPNYNLCYGTRMERKAKSTGKEVCQFDLDGNFIKSFASIVEAANAVGGQKAPISNCCLGRSHSSYGYKWSFKEKESS